MPTGELAGTPARVASPPPRVAATLLQVGLGYSPLASGIRMLVFTMMPLRAELARQLWVVMSYMARFVAITCVQLWP
jgi:hypothetical protein